MGLIQSLRTHQNDELKATERLIWALGENICSVGATVAQCRNSNPNLTSQTFS